MTRLLNHEKDLSQSRDSNIPAKEVVSPWRTPIPLKEYHMSPVVVYFYSNEWIPMKCFSLGEAIALYRKASLLGKKIIVYPPYLDPYINRSAAPPCASEEDEKHYSVTAS
jgi:hypothetical protein